MKVQLIICGVVAMAAYASGAIAQPPQDSAAILAGDVAKGAELFSANCEACHASGVGPSLRGVIGRPVASVSGFAGYTDALKAMSSDSWTEANLDKFLSDAQAYAPGSAMTVLMTEAQERADVVAYLASLPPPRQ